MFEVQAAVLQQIQLLVAAVLTPQILCWLQYPLDIWK